MSGYAFWLTRPTALLSSSQIPLSVMPAKAGIQGFFFCICSRRIPGQSPGHASCGLERPPGEDSAMRWRRYKT